MKEVFLHEKDMPERCVDCPFFKRKYAVFDLPIICCITGNTIAEKLDDKTVLRERHKTCPLVPLKEKE